MTRTLAVILVVGCCVVAVLSSVVGMAYQKKLDNAYWSAEIKENYILKLQCDNRIDVEKSIAHDEAIIECFVELGLGEKE